MKYKIRVAYEIELETTVEAKDLQTALETAKHDYANGVGEWRTNRVSREQWSAER